MWRRWSELVDGARIERAADRHRRLHSIAVAQARARADDLELSSTATFSTGYFERDDITKNRGK